jgi:hypothetical protein
MVVIMVILCLAPDFTAVCCCCCCCCCCCPLLLLLLLLLTAVGCCCCCPGMRMSIKRCPLTRMAGQSDVTWEVTDWLKSVVHPTYDLTGVLNSSDI